MTHELCMYELIDERIHAFQLQQNTDEAVVKWFELMSQMYDAHNETAIEPVMLLFDLRVSGEPSKIFTTITLRQWLNEHPPTKRTKIAIVYDRNVILSVVTSFTRMLRLKQEIKFFYAEEYDRALSWLKA